MQRLSQIADTNIALLRGCAVQAFGVRQVNETDAFRMIGMAMTFTTLIAASAYVLYSYLGSSGV
jgi:uncharacterized membrane protein YecN with MAPEG domain